MHSHRLSLTRGLVKLPFFDDPQLQQTVQQQQQSSPRLQQQQQQQFMNNGEDSTEIQQKVNDEEDFAEYQHNVQDLEKKLALRQQSMIKWMVKDFNGVEFDLNLFIGLEKGTLEKSQEMLSCIKKMDSLIERHFAKNKNPTLSDIRDVLPTYTRSDTLPTQKVPLLISIQFDHLGERISKSLLGNREMTADALISQFFTKVKFEDLRGTKPEGWTLKVIGAAQYMYGKKFKLGEYEFIQDAIQKGLKKIDIALIRAEEAVGNTSVLVDTVLSTIDMDCTYNIEPIVSYNYDDIKKQAKPNVIPLWDQTGPVLCRIVSLGDINPQNLAHAPVLAKSIEDRLFDQDVVIEFDVLYADSRLVDGPARCTNPMKMLDNKTTWNQNLSLDDLPWHDLPRESIGQITVFHRVSTKNADSTFRLDSDNPIFIVRFPMIDDECKLISGKKTFRMWPILPGTRPARVVCSNQFDPACTITIEFATNQYPVVFTAKGTLPRHLTSSYAQYQIKMTQKYPNKMETLNDELNNIINADILYELTEKDKWRMFYRANKIKDNSKALHKYLLSVPWRYPSAVQLAHKLLTEWKSIGTIDALELLDTRFPDWEIRQYAVKILDQLPDDELNLFLLQLVQCMKNELYHDTPLARFLLGRALRNAHQIGHALFWNLKAELHNSHCKERFILILEEYLKAANSHRIQLSNQISLVNDLLDLALKVKRYHSKSTEEKTNYLQELLGSFSFKKCLLPLNPRMEVTNLIVNKCKVMGSKKLPLWLVFENTDDPDGGRLPVIFKAGDDIRQDTLTMQLLSIMDNIWRQNGLGLHMKIYGCVSCGDMNGFIEVVQKSDTVANITNDYGGSSAVFKKEPLEVWLRQKNNNPTDAQWKDIVENFARSCSAYCVATYVLGIGDRHNDNIMLQECGDLFHIDFGHFLGNYKKKLGIKRENAPFVFTNMYAHVLNGLESEEFALFKNLCCKAYNLIRKNGNLIMNLLRLMIGTGIPELQCVDDIAWIQKCIIVNKSDDEAAEHFSNLIHSSYGNARTKIMEYTHILSQNIKK